MEICMDIVIPNGKVIYEKVCEKCVFERPLDSGEMIYGFRNSRFIICLNIKYPHYFL